MEAALPRSTLSLLERLSEHHKCVFREEVLARLSVKDRLFLARTSHELRAAVLTSGLPIVGDGRRRITMYRDGVHSIACGPLRVFQYCVAQGCPWLSPHTPELASLAGNVPVLTWAHEMGCPWDRRTCLRAACGTTPSHLACLAYAHAHGCAWDERVFADAAATAPLKTLRYLFDEGCPYDESIAESAAAHGRLDVLETFPSTAKFGGVAVTLRGGVARPPALPQVRRRDVTVRVPRGGARAPERQGPSTCVEIARSSRARPAFCV